MISSLEVMNFQSWGHGILEFCDGVNVIKGTSHHGKSSLIRALDWILNNRPISDEMRPWSDEKKKLNVIASVEFDNGNFISREKSKKFNGYNSSIGELEALGRDIPLEITELANMQENLHRQDDGYFLLSESPGNVARVLNRKSGLEDIDIIQKATRGFLSELQSELRRNETNKKELQEEFRKLNEKAKLKPLFEEITNLIADYDGTKKLVREISDHLRSINHILAEIESTESFLSNEKEIEEISNLIQDVKESEALRTNISHLFISIKDCSKLIHHQEILISNENQVADISELIHDYYEIEKKCDGIDSLQRRISSIVTSIKMATPQLVNYECKKAELEKQLDYCPSCGAHKDHWGNK